MAGVERHLRVVPPAPAGSEAPSSEGADVGLTTAIFLIAALPLASAIAGVGRWDDASLGLGTLGVLLTGRELCAWLVARHRARRSGSGSSSPGSGPRPSPPGTVSPSF